MGLDAYAWIPTIQTVKEFLEVEDDRDTPILERVTNSATSAIERMLDRRIIARTQTKLFDGNGRNALVLPEFPVVSVTSVYLSRTAESDGTALDSTYYEVDADEPEEGILYLLGGYRFPRGRRNVKITWVAGYSVIDTEGYTRIPWDLVELLLGFVAHLWRKRDTIGDERLTQTLDGITTTFARDFWTDERRRMLARYRKV